MKDILKILIEWFIKRDMFLILFLTIGSIFLISKVPDLQIKADNEVLLNKKSVAYQNYTHFVEAFSSDRILIVLFEGEVFDSENLKLIDQFSKKVESIKGINEVVSITNAEGFEKSLFAIRPFPVYQKWKTDNKELSWFKESLKSNHFITKNLLAKDHSASLVLLTLNDDVEEGLRNDIVVGVQQILKEYQSSNLHATLAGVPLEEYLFLNSIKSDQKKLVPLIFIFLALMCLIFVRGWAAILSSLGAILLTILWLQGTIVWFGRYINPITSLLSPVIMVISLAHVIHIFNHAGQHKSITRDNVNIVILDIISQIGLPSLLAAITTAVGFFSLGVSDNPAVREFGFFAGIASFYSFFISFALSMIAIKRIGIFDKKVGIDFPQRLLPNLCYVLRRFKMLIFLMGLIICVFIINGIFRLDVDTKLLSYLKDKDRIMHSVNIIDKEFNGSNSLEVVLTVKDGTFFDYKNFIMLHQLTEILKTIPKLQNVNSFNDLIINLHQVIERRDSEPLPSKKRLKLFYDMLKNRKDKKLYKFISKDFKTVRVNCLLLNSSTRQILDVKQAIDQKIQSLDSLKVSSYVTGRDFLFSDMSHTLVHGQIRTMLWAGVPISIMVFLSLMSFRFGVAGIMAMGIPIAMTYGVMGYKSIALNTATIMISSVAMGLLVDDTIHFLYRFKQELKKEGSTPLKSIETTLQVTGKAIIITSLILIGGFSVGITGSVIPTIHFSLLMGLAALLSLLINIIFLPTTLLIITQIFTSKKIV